MCTVFFSQLKLLDQLGSGAFGRVVKAEAEGILLKGRTSIVAGQFYPNSTSSFPTQKNCAFITLAFSTIIPLVFSENGET